MAAGMRAAPLWPFGGNLLAVASLAIVASAVLAFAQSPFLMDFFSFWAAAVMALDGQSANVYDAEQLFRIQSQIYTFDARMPFAYPPPYLLLLTPLGAFPYIISAILWIVLSLTVYAIAARRLMPGYGGWALAFVPVIVSAIVGQNGLLTAALLMGGLALLQRHGFWGGAVLGCMIIKPQLGLLFPLAFVAARDWRAFAGAACSVLTLCLLSLVVFGLATWIAFVGQLMPASEIATGNLVGWHKMASVFAMARMAGVPEPVALTLHAGCAVAGAALVWRVWRTNNDAWARGAALAPASLLVSPYLFMYDQVMLIVSLAWLASCGADRRLLALMFATPVVAALQFWWPEPAINVAPLLTLAILIRVEEMSRARTRASAWRPSQSAA